MDQLNPGLRNLVNLGKSYGKAVTGTDSSLTKDPIGCKLSENYAKENICGLVPPSHINVSGICISNTTPNGPLTLLTERLTACVLCPPVQQWPWPVRPISRRCPNLERMPSSPWCLRSSVSVRVLLSVAEGCSRFHLNVNAMLLWGTGWFAGSETWSCFYQNWPNPFNFMGCNKQKMNEFKVYSFF